MIKCTEKLITIVVPDYIYKKLDSIKKSKGVTIQFQVNKILKEALCKS